MRSSGPLPHVLPPAAPLAELRQAVNRVERDYNRLLSQHLAYAHAALDGDPT